MSKIIIFFTLALFSCTSRDSKTESLGVEPKPLPIYTPIDAEKIITTSCTKENIKKMPKLKLVEVFLCGEVLSIQYNKAYKNPHVKLIYSDTLSEEPHKILVTEIYQINHLKKLINQMYNQSEEQRVSK